MLSQSHSVSEGHTLQGRTVRTTKPQKWLRIFVSFNTLPCVLKRPFTAMKECFRPPHFVNLTGLFGPKIFTGENSTLKNDRYRLGRLSLSIRKGIVAADI